MKITNNLKEEFVMAIIPKKERRGKIEIDLTGPEGNAFVLRGYAQRYGKQLGWDKEKQDEVRKEMTSGDYENLIQVFDKYFGDFVDLMR